MNKKYVSQGPKGKQQTIQKKNIFDENKDNLIIILFLDANQYEYNVLSCYG